MSFRSRFICQVESKTACACIQLRVQENSFRLQIVSLHDFLSDVTVVSSVQPISLRHVVGMILWVCSQGATMRCRPVATIAA